MAGALFRKLITVLRRVGFSSAVGNDPNNRTRGWGGGLMTSGILVFSLADCDEDAAMTALWSV